MFDHNWADWNYPVIVANDPESGAVTPEVEFYVYGQASKFVDRGAERIASDTLDGVIEPLRLRALAALKC